jgi:hypothetical protein
LGAWFGQLGPAVVDFGIGSGAPGWSAGTRAPAGPGGALSGCVVISAADIEDVIGLARAARPAQRRRRRGGEIVPAS